MEYEKPLTFYECRRCGEHSYETLQSYGYCINCNYSYSADGNVQFQEFPKIPRCLLDKPIKKENDFHLNPNTQKVAEAVEQLSA